MSPDLKARRVSYPGAVWEKITLICALIFSIKNIKVNYLITREAWFALALSVSNTSCTNEH